MSSIIYYFTGTGNSMIVARKLSRLLNCECCSISSRRNESEIIENSDIIGIVFPCYLAQIDGIPLIVGEFIKKIKIKTDSYIFVVCTYGAFGLFNYIPTFGALRTLVKESNLPRVGEFSIKLPLNNLDYEHVPVPVNRNQEIMFRYTDREVQKIYINVTNRKMNIDYCFNGIFFWLTRPLFFILGKYVIKALKKHAKVNEEKEYTFEELVHMSDRDIYSDEKCNGCGICEKICPVSNIHIVESKPEWLHKCEMCLACDEWCPQRAIHHWCKVIGKNYHHPEVTLKDMLTQTKLR